MCMYIYVYMYIICRYILRSPSILPSFHSNVHIGQDEFFDIPDGAAARIADLKVDSLVRGTDFQREFEDALGESLEWDTKDTWMTMTVA